MTFPSKTPKGDEAPALIHHLSGDVLSPAKARALVGDALVTLPEETVGLAQLLTSELVTNVVLHAHTGLDLQIEITDYRARITVQDSSADDPQPHGTSLDLASGRGLALVDGMSSVWGCDHVPGGKRVWFELPAPNSD
jgi:hypothetical protein